MPITITIPPAQLWDKKNEIFVYTKEQTVMLEHSLVSMSKWEAKWHIPYLSKDNKTREQILDYILCMCLTKNVDPKVFNYLTNNNISDITKYIEDPMTATWINKKDKTRSRRVITSELLYSYMFSLNIPIECEKWHLNRLITLIDVCGEENRPKKGKKGKELYSRNNALNEARKMKLHTKG